jgi:hypothetical protein
MGLAQAAAMLSLSLAILYLPQSLAMGELSSGPAIVPTNVSNQDCAAAEVGCGQGATENSWCGQCFCCDRLS